MKGSTADAAVVSSEPGDIDTGIGPDPVEQPEGANEFQQVMQDHKKCSCTKSSQQYHVLVCCKGALVLSWLLTMILKGFKKQLLQGKAAVYQRKEHVLYGFGFYQLYWICVSMVAVADRAQCGSGAGGAQTGACPAWSRSPMGSQH